MEASHQESTSFLPQIHPSQSYYPQYSRAHSQLSSTHLNPTPILNPIPLRYSYYPANPPSYLSEPSQSFAQSVIPLRHFPTNEIHMPPFPLPHQISPNPSNTTSGFENDNVQFSSQTIPTTHGDESLDTPIFPLFDDKKRVREKNRRERERSALKSLEDMLEMKSDGGRGQIPFTILMRSYLVRCSKIQILKQAKRKIINLHLAIQLLDPNFSPPVLGSEKNSLPPIPMKRQH